MIKQKLEQKSQLLLLICTVTLEEGNLDKFKREDFYRLDCYNLPIGGVCP